MCVCALVCFERKQYNLFVKKKKTTLNLIEFKDILMC